MGKKIEKSSQSKPRKSTRARGESAAKAQIVAQRAGVSLMTVSRVFSGSSSVAEKTKKRVLEAANEVGYSPNTAARALRTGKSNAVGFLLASPMGLAGEFHSQTFSGFESVLAPREMGVVISVVSTSDQLVSKAMQMVASGRCGALVVRFDVINPDDIERLTKLNAPVILANFSPENKNTDILISSIGFDNRKGIQRAVRYLHSLGHKRIAHLGGTEGWIDSIRREKGFRAGMQEMKLSINERWMVNCDFSSGFQTGTSEMNNIFSLDPNGPTAVICDSDEIAAGAMSAAAQWGKSIPKDFSVIGFDDARWASFVTPPLTSIRHDGLELGQKLGTMLLRQLDNPDQPCKREVLEARLVVRESTGPAPK